MLLHSGWAEAVRTSAFVRNRVATTATKPEETPYKRWHGSIPDIAFLKLSGCTVYAHVPDSHRAKLDKKDKQKARRRHQLVMQEL